MFRTVLKWRSQFETQTYLEECHRGKHSKTKSPITDPLFRDEFRAHVKIISMKKGELLKIIVQFPLRSKYKMFIMKLLDMSYKAKPL